MVIAAKPIRNLLVGIFIFVVMGFSVGCVKVSDLVNQIPALFITSYAVTFASLVRNRISSVFLSVVSVFMVMLLFYFRVQGISDFAGSTISNFLTYFLIQIIPFLLYTWLCTLGLVALRSKYPKTFSGLSNAVLSGIPSGIVLVVYSGFLFSGFCYDCYISNTFQLVFGWPFNLLDMIK